MGLVFASRHDLVELAFNPGPGFCPRLYYLSRTRAPPAHESFRAVLVGGVKVVPRVRGGGKVVETELCAAAIDFFSLDLAVS